MSGHINEVRERAEELASALEELDAPQDAATIRALLDAHARVSQEALNSARLHWLVIKAAGGDVGVFIPNRVVEEADWGAADIVRHARNGGVTLRAICKKAVQP